MPGIIPAYAGSTPLTDLKSVGGGDHPRIRGEHRLSGLYTGDGQGSSPHTRGARRPERVGQVGRRIIPAYAGSTVDYRDRLMTLKDHPRIRGEHAPR